MSATSTITHGDYQGLPALLIRTPQASAALSLHGGQLLSFVPHGFDDLLWLSPIRTRPPGAIRGGVPVCWPYFGRQGQASAVPQHGFARNSAWTLQDAQVDPQGGMTLHLALPMPDARGLRLTQTLHLGDVLQQSLTTEHTGDVAATFTQALHSYFKVGDASRVHVTGLRGLRYADNYDGAAHPQDGDWTLQDARDPGRSDRIYHRTGDCFELHDPVLRRCITLQTSGSRSLVVWNPGASGIAAIADAPADAWRNFVCLEAANAGEDVIVVAPGQRHTLQQTLRVSPAT
jgi:glucose-6-phosphate 1-epimerase